MDTARIAFTVVKNPLTPAILNGEPVLLEDLQLAEKPLITESDLVCFTWANSIHRFRLRPSCVERLPSRLPAEGVPFLLTVRGERIYLGVFQQERSRHENRIPTILLNLDRASEACLYDWYWIQRNHPHRIQPGPDPREDPRVLQAIREGGFEHSPESEAWTQPLSSVELPADGQSGIRLHISRQSRLDLEGHGVSSSIDAFAIPVDSRDKTPIAQADLNENLQADLALPHGVYVIGVRFDWRKCGSPLRVPKVIHRVEEGFWSELTLGR